jgi:hypothetical protein
MTLKNLAYSAEEIKERSPKLAETPPEYGGPKYPWGLSLHLDEGSMEKLGLDIAKFKIGQKVPLSVIATVTSLSMNETEHGKYQCMDLMCGQLEVKAAKSNDEAADELYGKK